MNAIMDSIGLTAMGDGGFAEYMLVRNPAQMLFVMPDTISFEEGAIVEPLSTSLHGVRASRFKPGDVALVIGAGPIGLGTIEFLKIGGAGKIIVMEVSAGRSQAALALGADIVLNPDKEGDFLTMKFNELTAGLGVDIVFECSGVPFGFQNSLNFVKYGGQVMVVGIAEDTVVSPLIFSLKEVEMKGCFSYTSEEFQMVIDFLAQRRINTKPMIGEVISLEDIQASFQSLKNSRDVVKILVRP